MSGSGGNYPPSYHLQSPQGYVHPRHRLPIMPPHRPPSYGSPNISQAHMSQASPWTNKHAYTSNYHETASPYYSSSMPRDYAAAISHFGPEEAARWAANQPFINAAAVAAAATMGATNPYEHLEKLESRLPGSAASFLKGMQHESMDLSSSHMNVEPPVAHSPIITSRSSSDLNGEVSRRTASLKNPLKLASSFSAIERIKLTANKGGGNAIESAFKKDTVVSVIAENPIRDNKGGSPTAVVESYNKELPPNLTKSMIEQSPLSMEKENKRYGEPMTVIEATKMKSKEDFAEEAATNLNLTSRAPPMMQIGDNLTVVKLPSSARQDSSSSSSSSSNSSSSSSSNSSSSNAKNALWQGDEIFINKDSSSSKYSSSGGERFYGKDVGKCDVKFDVASNLSKQPHNSESVRSPLPYIQKPCQSSDDVAKPDAATVAKQATSNKSTNGISDNVELRLENMFHVANTSSTSSSSSLLSTTSTAAATGMTTSSTVLQSSVIVSNQTNNKLTSSLVSTLKTDSVEKMLKSPSPDKNVNNESPVDSAGKTDDENYSNSSADKTPLLSADSSVIKLNEEHKSVIVSEIKTSNIDLNAATDGIKSLINNQTSVLSSNDVIVKQNKPLLTDNVNIRDNSKKDCAPIKVASFASLSALSSIDVAAVTPDKNTYSACIVPPPPAVKNESVVDEGNNDNKPLFDLNRVVASPIEKSMSPSKSAAAIPEKDTIVKVETELEKLFAGIMDTSEEPSGNENSSSASTNTSVKTETNNSFETPDIRLTAINLSSTVVGGTATNKRAKEKPKTQQKKITNRSNRITKKKDGFVVKDCPPVGLKDIIKPTMFKQSHHKDVSNETTSSKLRVPTIHIEGSKESPLSWTIINNGTKHHEEDEASEAKMSLKKKLKVDPNKKFVVNYNHGKAFDPESVDESWICMFCKLGPHCPGTGGDPTGVLFGPYFVTVLDDQSADGKKRVRKGAVHQPESANKRKKRSLSNDGTTLDGEKRIEIWGHYNCIVWTCGIHLLGSSLLGLEDAVHSSMNTKCNHCGEFGASMGCQTKNCKLRVHYSCGVFTGWELNPATYTARCRTHHF